MWKVLYRGFKQRDIVKSEQIFIACCVLHNFLLDLMVRNHVRAGRGDPIIIDGLWLDGHTVMMKSMTTMTMTRMRITTTMLMDNSRIIIPYFFITSS
jgi:hypothetical protein